MPAARFARPPSPRLTGFALAFALLVGTAAGQPPAPKPAAVRLPDGTVVFVTKNPDDPNAPVDGVLLSAKEYQAYVDQADQLKKLKDAAKPAAPSACHVAARVEAAGGQPVAVLAVAYSFQTTAPRAVVALGGQRGLPRSAKAADGTLPVLGLADDGLTVLVEKPGAHGLTVEFEAPVSARGGAGEVGFDIGLPKAAVTTLTVDPVPPGKGLTVGTRTPDRPAEVRRAAYRAGAALGPTDLLELAWTPPTPAGPAPVPEVTAETDVTVRVDEVQVETTAKIRLKGAGKDWQLVLPPAADVTVERAGAADPGLAPVAATLAKPTDPGKPVWTVRVPVGGPGEWLVTATTRQVRPKPNEPKYRGPYPVGPFAVPAAARHAGTVRVFAPPAVRVGFKANPDVRRQDLPPAADDDLVGVFRFGFGPLPKSKPPAPLLELDARPAQGFVRIEPTYRLHLTRTGWRMTADLTVTPVRAEVDHLVIELPDGWPGGEEAAAPRRGTGGDLVDEVEVLKDANPRALAVRLGTPQKGPFDLILSATFPVGPGVREAGIGLPRFPQAVEQNAKLTATVPDGLELRGTATGRDGGPGGDPIELKAAAAPGSEARAAGVTAVAAAFDKGVGRVDLGWQPYRPELTADVRAEIALGERQAVVTETVTLRVADGGAWRPVRFRGPPTAAGMKARDLAPVGPGEWELAAPAAGTREVVQQLVYAVPVPPGAGPLDVGLFWPDAATRVDATARVWGGAGGRRVARFDGPWRELPPVPDPARDALPWLTLTGTGAGLKLALELTDPAAGPLPAVWVDRALVQAWVGADVAAVRGRFLLKTWPAPGLDLIVPGGVVPEVFVDGARSENVTASGAPGAVRVPLPDAKPGRTGLVLDVRFQAPTPRTAWGDLRLTPPALVGAAYRGPARWQAFFVPGTVPVVAAPDLTPDARWAWRDGLFAPTAGATAEELEAWFAAGSDGDPGPGPAGLPVPPADPDALTARQPEPGPVTVYLVPRAGWVAGCSLAALLAVLALSRLRPELLGPAVAFAGMAVAAAAVVAPQPTAQAAGGCQPGLWVAATVLVLQAAWRWYHRRRITHLPGFTRTRPESGVNGAPVPSGAGSNLVPLNEPLGTSNPPGR